MINTETLAQQLIDGKKSIRLVGIWDFKPSYLGRPSLFNRAGRDRVAFPGLTAREGETEE